MLDNDDLITSAALTRAVDSYSVNKGEFKVSLEYMFVHFLNLIISFVLFFDNLVW